MKFFKWFGGFFEDQNNSASSKRATLYVCLFFLYLIVKESLVGAKIDLNVLLIVAAIILFCLGAVTSEFFKDLKFLKKEEDKLEK